LREVRSGSPTVEVILLSATGGRLRFRVRRHRLYSGAHPDALLAGTDDAVALAARDRPDLCDLIGKLPPGCAGTVPG
jgi:hypothetical protein